MTHDCQDLIRLFNACFSGDYNTVLVGGSAEPEYLPADEHHLQHRILFTRDYFRSALHEVAHWCVAGAQRRLLVDFGYWYAPDGRNADQQKAFEQVEVKPQALELLFCEAAGHRFSVSMDNLGGERTDPQPFIDAVQRQRTQYLVEGLPERPARFIAALRDYYFPDCSSAVAFDTGYVSCA
ncbi:elongation factor P hydroxylase [Halopseudomonas salina]|uniref:Elongation factor P hydroxylase n=1 Tax=Halopseudomonas salina TaxID=1323744 RepID=A0ABQ1P3J6_9GAMM|nr:elongation factor P hydroxylase [Halopseudomonas salina]GGC89689.1 elongation factor P hydroxylase [Halopseudomonas salina]